jgi:hypothetical protein
MDDATSKRTGKSLNQLVAARKNYDKGSSEYNAIQNEINKSYGVSKRHAQDKKTKVDVDGKMVIKKKGDGDDTKIKTGTSKIAGGEGKTVIKTKGGESTTTRGGDKSADTGNKSTKAKADATKGGKKGGTLSKGDEAAAASYEREAAEGGKGSNLAGRIGKRIRKGKGDNKKTVKMEGRLMRKTGGEKEKKSAMTMKNEKSSAVKNYKKGYYGAK